jgi:CoA:oxalate CoA-transferase
MVLTVPHPGRGDVRMLGFPMKLTFAPCSVRLPVPGLGEHSDAVLEELGYDAAARAALRTAGVV